MAAGASGAGSSGVSPAASPAGASTSPPLAWTPKVGASSAGGDRDATDCSTSMAAKGRDQDQLTAIVRPAANGNTMKFAFICPLQAVISRPTS